MTLLTALAFGGLAAGGAGCIVATLAYRRVLRLRDEWVAGARGAERVTEAPFQGNVDPYAIRDVAMLRYDAFRDMGGRLSFSLALLDVAGDGVILTSINAPSETRTYAKIIQAGESTHDLSPEEEQVLHDARQGPPRAGHAPVARARTGDGGGAMDGRREQRARTRSRH